MYFLPLPSSHHHILDESLAVLGWRGYWSEALYAGCGSAEVSRSGNEVAWSVEVRMSYSVVNTESFHDKHDIV